MMLIINVYAQFNNVRNTYQMYNFSINPIESQPSGSINSNHIFFRKNKKYQKYQIKKNNNIDFGKKITFSLLNDLCYNDFEKNNVINCLKKYPNEWWCIYDNCISPSKNSIIYIQFELPYAY